MLLIYTKDENRNAINQICQDPCFIGLMEGFTMLNVDAFVWGKCFPLSQARTRIFCLKPEACTHLNYYMPPVVV